MQNGTPRLTRVQQLLRAIGCILQDEAACAATAGGAAAVAGGPGGSRSLVTLCAHGSSVAVTSAIESPARLCPPFASTGAGLTCGRRNAYTSVGLQTRQRTSQHDTQYTPQQQQQLQQSQRHEMLRAEALAALAHASSFDELWSWLRQRAQGLNYHSAAAAQGATTSRAHCDDGSAWNAADGTAAATLPQEAGAECPQAPQLQHQQPPLPPVEQLGWGPDLALAFVGRLQELGAVLHAPARRTLLREATSQWLAAGVPEQQPAAAGAEAAEAGGPAATGEGAAAGAGAGAAERRHAACLATGGDVLCVTPSPEAAQRLLAAVRSLGDPEQPGSQLVLALAAPHFGRLHRAITNVDGSSGGPSKSVEVGAGGGGGPGASSAGLPPARWPPSSAAAAALVSLGAEMVRAGFPVSFTQAAVAAKSAAVTPGSVEAPVFQAVWEVVGRCVTMPGPDPSLPPLPALVAARAALRVELGLARAAEVLRRGGDAVKGVPGAAAAGAAADGAVRDEPGAARVLQQLLMNTRDTARTGRALSADQLLECAQRVEAAEAAAEVAGGVGEAAVITRAGSRRPAETAAANIRGGTRGFVTQLVLAHAAALDTLTAPPERLLALAHACLLLEKRGARAVDDLMVMRHEGQRLQGALGRTLMRRLQKGSGVLATPPPPPQQLAPSHRHGRSRPPPAKREVEERQQQEERQQAEVRRVERVLRQQLMQLLLHPRNTRPPLELRQAVTDLLLRGGVGGGAGVGGAAGGAAGGGLWDHVRPTVFDVVLRRLMATPIYWRWQPPQPPQPSYAAAAADTLVPGAAAANAAQGCHGPGWPGVGQEHLDYYVHPVETGVLVGEAGTEAEALSLARAELAAAEEEVGMVAAAEAVGARARARGAASSGLGRSLPHGGASAAELPVGLSAVAMHMAKVVAEAEEDVRWASRRPAPAASGQADDPTDDAAAHLPEEGATSRVPAATAFGLFHLAADLLRRGAPPAGVAAEADAMGTAEEEAPSQASSEPLGEAGAVHKPAFASRTATGASTAATLPAAAAVLLSNSSRLLARLLRQGPGAGASAGADDRSSDTPWGRGDAAGLALSHALAEQYGRLGQLAAADAAVLGLIVQGAERGAAEALRDAHALRVSATATAQMGSGRQDSGSAGALERARAAALEARLRQRLRQLATVSEVLAERWYEPAADCRLTQQLEDLVTALCAPTHERRLGAAGPAQLMPTGALPVVATPGTSGHQAPQAAPSAAPAPAPAPAAPAAATTAVASVDHDTFRLLCATAWLASLPRAGERLRREERREQAEAEAQQQFLEEEAAADAGASSGGFDSGSSGGISSPADQRVAVPVVAEGEALASDEADARALRLVRLVEGQVAAAASSSSSNAAAAAAAAAAATSTPASAGMGAASAQGAGLLSLRTAYALTEAFMNVGVMPPVVRRLLSEEVPLAARGPLSRGGGAGAGAPALQAGAELPGVVGGRSRVIARVYRQVFAARVLGGGAAGAAGASGAAGAVGDGAIAGGGDAHDLPHSRRVRLAVRLLHEGIIGPRDALAALRGDLEHVLPRLRDPRRLAALVGMVAAAPAAPPSREALLQLSVRQPRPRLESAGAASQAALGLPDADAFGPVPTPVVSGGEAALDAEAEGQQNERARAEARASQDRAGVLFKPLALMAKDRAVPLEHLRIICATLHACPVVLPPYVMAALTERLKWEIPLPKPLPQRQQQWQQQPPPGHGPATGVVSASLEPVAAQGSPDSGAAAGPGAADDLDMLAETSSLGVTGAAAAGHPSFSALAQAASDADRHAHLDQLVVFWLRQLQQSGKLGYQVEANAAGHRATPPCGAAAGAEAELPLGIGSSSSRSSSRSSFAAVCGYASDVIAASSQRTAGESELQEGGLLVRVAARAVDSLLMQGCQGGGRSAGFSRSDANGHDSVGGPGQNAESSEGVPGLTPPPLGAADDGTGGAEAAAEALRLVCLIAPTSGSLGAAQQSEIVNRVLAVLPARQASLHDSSDAGHVSPERGSQLDLAAQQAPQLRAPFLSASDAVDVLEQVSQARAAIWAPVVERVLQLLTSGGHQGRDRMAELVQQHMTQTSARRHQSHMDKLLRLTSEGMPVPGASLHGPWGASEGPEHLPAAYAVWRREVPAVLASVLQAAASSCPSLPSQKGEPVVAGGPLPQAQVQLLLDSLGQAVRLARSWLLQSVGAGGADVAAGAGAGTLAPQTQPLLLPLPAAATPRLTEAVAAALRALDAHAARMSLASLRRYLSDRDALQTWLEHQRRQQQLQEAAANGVAGEDAGACGQRQAYGVGVETQAASHRPAAAAAVNAAAAAVPQRDPLAALRRQSGLLQLAELLPELRGLATVFQALAAPPPTEAAKGDEEPGLPSGSQAEPQNVTLIQPDQVDAFSGAWPCLQEQLRLVEAALRAVYDSRRELAPADELMTAVGGAVAELPTELMQVLVQALQSADEACAAFNVARKALNWRLQEHKEAMREQLKRREDANAASAEVLRANAAAEQLSSQIMHSHIAVTAARDLVRAWQRESMLPLAEELAATLQAHAAQLLPAANAQSSTASPDAALEGATGSAAAAGAAASTADMLVSVLGSNNLAPPTAAPSSAECNLSPLRQFHMALGASAALAARGWWHDSLAAAALLAAGPAFCAVATANTGVTGGGGQGGAVAAAVYEVALPALRLHAAGCGRGAGAGDRQRELALVLLLQAMEDWGPAVLRAAKAPSAAATAPGAAVAASVPAALPAGHAQRQQGTQGPPPQQPSPVPPQPLAVELLLALVGVGYVRGQLPYALASDVLWQLEAARDDAEWGGASERGRTTGASGGAGGSSVGLHHSHLEALLTAAPALAHIGSGAGGAGRVDMGDLAAGGNLDPIAGGRRAVGDLLVELCRALCDSGMLEAAAAAPDSHGNSGAGVSVDAMCALAHALSQASAPPQPFLPRGLTTGAVTSITTGSSTRLAPSQHESKLYNRMYVLLLQGAVGPGPSPNSAAGPSNPNNAPQSEVQGGCGGAADLPAAVVRLARLAACGRNRGDVLMAAEAAAQLGGVLRRLAAEGDARTCAAVLEALDGLMREGHGWMGLVLSPPPPQLPRSTTARAAAASLAPASAHSASQQLQLYPLRHGPAQDIAALLADWPADEPTTGAASAILPDAAAARARQGSGNVRRRDEGGAFGAVRSTATPPKTEAVAALRPAAAATATVGPFVVAQLLWRSVDVLPTDIAVSVLGWAAGGRSEVTKQQAGAALRVGPGGDGDTGGLGSSAHSAHHTTAREQLVRVWQRLAGRILLDQAAGADAGSCRDRGREGDADGLLLDASGAASVLAAGEALGCVDVAMTQALADVVAQELEGDH